MNVEDLGFSGTGSAVRFSKSKNAGRADVHVVPIKNVKKPRGAKRGLVYVTGGKTVHLRREPERIERLLASRIDDFPAPFGPTKNVSGFNSMSTPGSPSGPSPMDLKFFIETRSITAATSSRAYIPRSYFDRPFDKLRIYSA